MFDRFKRKIRRYILSQLLYQLHEETPEELIDILTPKIMLALGIPSPIGDPLPESILHHDAVPYTPLFLEKHAAAIGGFGKEKALDIGCGITPQNLFQAKQIYGCDIRGSDDGSVIAVDLFNEPFPFSNDCFDYVTALDFVEHIPRAMNTTSGTVRFTFVAIMNEVYRVLKPGGVFFARTPAYPSRAAFQDPTHVNIITDVTFPLYFCQNKGEPLARMYGFHGSFTLSFQEWCQGWLFTLMRKQDSRTL